MSQPSLLSFLDAPVVVGDPDGRAAYVNPTFETRFSVSAEEVTGQPLASLFEGGVREAVLQAVAGVCARGVSGRFRVRHSGVGYAGLASPIVAADARVGVVILFNESAPDDERVHKLQREIGGPVEELARVFEELEARVAGDDKAVGLTGQGGRAVDQLRMWAESLGDVLAGRRPSAARGDRFDPAEVCNTVAGRLSEAFAASEVAIEVRLPAQLPPVAGDGDVFSRALEELLRARLAVSAPGSTVAIAARTLERDGANWVVLAVMDVRPGGGPVDTDEAPPPEVQRRLESLGADLRVTVDATSGRTVAIRLAALKH